MSLVRTVLWLGYDVSIVGGLWDLCLMVEGVVVWASMVEDVVDMEMGMTMVELHVTRGMSGSLGG